MQEPENGYQQFAEIDSFAADDFRNDMAIRYVSRAKNDDGTYKINAKTFSARIDPIILLYRQRDKLPDAIRSEPFGGQNSFQAAKPVSNSLPGWIPFVPDDIAKIVIPQFVSWVDNRFPDILRLHRERVELPHNQHVRLRYIDEVSFSVLPGDTTPWHPKLKSVGEIGDMVAAFRTICINLILATVGMRIGEILSLNDNCIVIESSTDGLMDIFYLQGQTTKVEKGPRVTRWVAGARPVGSEEIPIPIRAVKAILELFRPYRQANTLCALFPVTFGQFKTVTSKHIKRYDPVSFRSSNNLILNRWIKMPRPWHFTPHQWRKSFARFVIRNDRSAISALSGHFQHVSIAMTDRGYLGSDWQAWDLVEFMDDEQRQNTANILSKLLFNDDLIAGRMGPYLERVRVEFGGLTVEESAEDLRWIVEDSDLTVHTADWGFCIYRQETAWCNGDAKGPNLATRTPSGCAGCSNLAIHQQHRPYWADRRDRNQSLLDALSDAPELRREPVFQRVLESERILSDLDGSRNG